MTTCIVVDDEPLAGQLIASYIGQVPELHLLGNYRSALDAFAALHAHKVDVIFLDIDMPGITGIDFVKSLKQHPRIVFISAHTKFAVDAFEIEAVDFLAKPVSFERFLKAVDKILKPGLTHATEIPKEPTSIYLKVDKRLIKIDFSEIMYIEGMGDYLKVHTTKKTHVTYMTLARITALLPISKFARIHRSTLINSDSIQYIEGNLVIVNGISLPIGLTYREAFLEGLQ